MNPFYQKINAPSREVLELVLKIAAKIENHSSTIAAFVCAANDAPEKRVNMSSPEYYFRFPLCISRNNNILLKNRRLFQEREQGIQGVKLLDMGIRERGLTEWSILS